MKNHSMMDDTNTNPIEGIIVSALTGQASMEELSRLRLWLNESKANRKRYDEYAGIWGASSAAGRKDDFQPDVVWQSLSNRMKAKKHSLPSGFT